MALGAGLFVCVDGRVVVLGAIEISGALLVARLPVDGEKNRRNRSRFPSFILVCSHVWGDTDIKRS